MAYNEQLGRRLNEIFTEKSIAFETREMMGGLAIMVDDKMCVGIMKDELMARIDPGDMKELIQYRGVRQMEMGGRAMKGYVLVSPEIISTKTQLKVWVQRCLDYNPKAKSSKKKRA